MHVVRFQHGHRYYSIFFTHDKRLFGICEFVSLKGMYIRRCNFNKKLPSCGQAQGLVPFLRCWETYCAKQRVLPSFKKDPCNAVLETSFQWTLLRQWFPKPIWPWKYVKKNDMAHLHLVGPREGRMILCTNLVGTNEGPSIPHFTLDASHSTVDTLQFTL